MNISLTPEQKEFVTKSVESGRYHTAAEVLREGLRLLMDREQQEQQQLDILREELRKGIAEADRGNLRDGKEVFDELRAKLQRRSPG